MNEGQIVQLVALTGFLALILGSLSIRRLRAGFIVKAILAWAAIGAAIWLVVANKDALLGVFG